MSAVATVLAGFVAVLVIAVVASVAAVFASVLVAATVLVTAVLAAIAASTSHFFFNIYVFVFRHLYINARKKIIGSLILRKLQLRIYRGLDYIR